MARTKQQKLAKIIDNKNLANDLVIQIGEHSLTVGELRAMDEESEGASTAEFQRKLTDIERREGDLVTAQGALAGTLQTLADRLGVDINDLIDGKLDGVQPPRRTAAGGDESDPLAEIDPKVLSALEKKFGSGAVATEVAAMKKELADTRKALGIALRINTDDYYQNSWKELSGKVPKGADGKPLVELDLTRAMKYADDNGIKDKTGRLDLNRAFRDLTLEAQHKADLEAAEQRGIERGRQTAAAASMQRPGANRAELLKPPVDEKGRTHTIEHQLHEAMNDETIQRMLAGSVADA